MAHRLIDPLRLKLLMQTVMNCHRCFRTGMIFCIEKISQFLWHLGIPGIFSEKRQKDSFIHKGSYLLLQFLIKFRFYMVCLRIILQQRQSAYISGILHLIQLYLHNLENLLSGCLSMNQIMIAIISEKCPDQPMSRMCMIIRNKNVTALGHMILRKQYLTEQTLLQLFRRHFKITGCLPYRIQLLCGSCIKHDQILQNRLVVLAVGKCKIG